MDSKVPAASNMVPGSAPVPAEFKDLLDRPLLGHLATVRSDGAPRSTPMWFAWDGERLLFSSTRSRAKHVDVLARPHVAVSISDPDTFRHLEVRGVITSIEADEGCELWRALSLRYGDKVEGLPRDAAERVVYSLRPTRFVTFARRPDWQPAQLDEEVVS